jgi:hypothetical protein
VALGFAGAMDGETVADGSEFLSHRISSRFVPRTIGQTLASFLQGGVKPMQVRSWMAASTISAGMLCTFGLAGGVALLGAQTRSESQGTTSQAQSRSDTSAKKTPTEDSRTKAAAKKAPTYTVLLNVGVRGVSRKGCDIEIKPANSSCQFKPLTYHVASSEPTWIEVKGIETQSADRDCTFAITVHEPGYGERTFRRGLRLKKTGDARQALDCFVSSPSKLAQVERDQSTKR